MNKGTTLIEALLAIFIISLLAAVAGTFAVAARRHLDIELERGVIERDALLGVESVREAGHAAKEIIASAAFEGTSLTSSSTTLILSLPAFSSNGTPLTPATDRIAFRRDPADPKKLIRQIVADAGSVRKTGTAVVARHVEYLFFYYTSTTPAGALLFETSLATSGTVRNRSLQAHHSAWTALYNL